MKEQKKLANKLKQNKAITLIALVITIIVLLILAGVAISAISGNENTMDKAQKAKADNEKAEELDTIKLAVVDAVAMGSDGRVSKANLVAALRKIPEVVSASNVNDLETNGTASGPWTVIGQKGSYEVTASGTVSETVPKEIAIGDSVDYTTTSNGQELTDWKVFYKEGDYVYIIYGDYLPNAAVPDGMTGIVKGTGTNTHDTHASETRIQLLNAMNKGNWDSLLTGTLNKGKTGEKAVAQTRSTNVWAMGCPTLDLYVNSWNEKYPSNKIYTAPTAAAMSDGLTGYYVGTSENPSTYSANMSSTPGYSNTLYYPHAGSAYGGASGYWLASPSANNTNNVMRVRSNGYVASYIYNLGNGFRPVVCLPSSVLE